MKFNMQKVSRRKRHTGGPKRRTEIYSRARCMSHIYVKNEAGYKTPTDPDFSTANCQKLSRSCIIFKRLDFG